MYAIIATIVITTGSVGLSLWIESIEREAIERALVAVKDKEQEHTIDTQQDIISQQINSDVRKQNIKKSSDVIKEKTVKASTVVEKQNMQEQLSEEINCYIDEFNNRKVCEMSF